MAPNERIFVLLCLVEALVILAGMVTLTAAIILQFVLPLIIAREFLSPLRTGIVFSLTYGAGLATVLAFILSFRHTTLPLILISVLVILAVFILLIGEGRLRRRYGGAV